MDGHINFNAKVAYQNWITDFALQGMLYTIWNKNLMLLVANSLIGTKIKLTLAHGILWFVIIATMLCKCKLDPLYPIPLFSFIILMLEHFLLFWSCLFCWLILMLSPRTLAARGFTGVLSPRIGELQYLSVLWVQSYFWHNHF